MKKSVLLILARFGSVNRRADAPLERRDIVPVDAMDEIVLVARGESLRILSDRTSQPSRRQASS